MTEKNMKEKIYETFDSVKPDVLDSVLSRFDEEKDQIVNTGEQSLNVKKKSIPVKWIAAAAAALAIVIAGVIGFNIHSQNTAIASTIALDVSLSFEIEIDNSDKVFQINPLNEDGKVIAGEIDHIGGNIEDTLDELIVIIVERGFLNEPVNSILVTVDNDDPAVRSSFEERVMKEVEIALDKYDIKGTVITQAVETEGFQGHEDENERSYGLAHFIIV